MSKKSERVLTTIRMDKSMHDLLFNQVRWELKKPVGVIITESVKQYLTKHGFEVK